MTNLVRIFFHFGPGAHPEVEKMWISEKRSEKIDFWQQPFYDGKKDDYIPFLIKQAELKVLKELEAGHEVELIGHSFGAFLINELPQEVLDRVSKVIFLAPTFNFFESISSLIKFGIEKHGETQLEVDFAELQNNPTGDKLLGLFSQFVEFFPDYLKLYFHRSEDFIKYIQYASVCPLPDGPSQMKGVLELVDDYNNELHLKNYHKVTVYLGVFDPLIPESKRKELEKNFGAGSIIELQVGHFPHLETDIIF